MLDHPVHTVKSDVLIIGAGIIGLSCAYELQKRGVSVTVIDQSGPGQGCSYGNAGWITPCCAQPLPMPGMCLQSFKWLLDPLSPLYIKPEMSWLFARWMMRFLTSMNRRQAEVSVTALVELSEYSLATWRQWAKTFPLSFSMENKGLLMVAQTPHALRSARDQITLMSAHGISGRYLDADALRQLEPAVTGEVKGGVYFPDQAHLEPFEAVTSIAEAAVRAGARIVSGTEALDFVTDHQRIQAVQTTQGLFQANQFILETGAWSHAIGKKLKLSIPVLGGKGYAITFSTAKPVTGIPVLVVDRKIAITPRKNGVRVAGTLELVNQDFSVTARRRQAVIAGARTCVHFPEEASVTEYWHGLRPCTPDGVPIMDFSPTYKNLFVTTGHQMLGLQTAPGSARLAADLLTGVVPCFDPYPFRMGRF